MTINEKIQEAKRLIEAADAVIITTGAGASVDSGLPDYRSKGGLWKDANLPNIANVNNDFMSLATGVMFHLSPQRAWGFYADRLEQYRDTIPHKGYELLHNLMNTKDVFCYTTNVDGQLQKAGFPEDKIVERHGSIHWIQCMRCTSPSNPEKAFITRNVNSICENTLQLSVQKSRVVDLPKCKCGGILRPNILMFDDGDWEYDRTRAQEVRFRKWLEKYDNPSKGTKYKVVLIEIGAGVTVNSVRRESEKLTKMTKGTLIRINDIHDQIDDRFGFSIKGKAKEVLEKIL